MTDLTLSKEEVLKIQLEKYDFDVGPMDYRQAIEKFGSLCNEGNYVDACHIAREFMFKFAIAKFIEIELESFKSKPKERIHIDTSIANFKE